MCLVAGHVRNFGRFLVLTLPSGVVNVVSKVVAIQEVEVYFPRVGLWLPCRTTLSAVALVPLVVSAAYCSSAVVPLVGGWASSATSMGVIVVVRVRWDSSSSTATSIWFLVRAVWLVILPMVVGAAPLAPRSLSFASFLARIVLLLIWWRLLWGWYVDSCGRWNERWVWRCEICGLHRMGVVGAAPLALPT